MLTLDKIAWREVEIPFRWANWYHEVLLGGIDIHCCNFNQSTFRVCKNKTIFVWVIFFPKGTVFVLGFFLMVSQNPILWKPTWKWFEFHGGHIFPPHVLGIAWITRSHADLTVATQKWETSQKNKLMLAILHMTKTLKLFLCIQHSCCRFWQVRLCVCFFW